MTGALTVAGSDSSGGAGVVADVRTFWSFGLWPLVAVTAVTAQSAAGVTALSVMPAPLVSAQLVACDGAFAAAKTGMLGRAAVVAAVARFFSLSGRPLVVDPVLMSSSGAPLLDERGVSVLVSELLPLATVVTPNLAEAARLTGLEVSDRSSMEAAGRALVGLGAAAALVTGGHLGGAVVADCLVVGDEVVWFEGPRVAGGTAVHGTGCALSAAVAAGLAVGFDVEEACRRGVGFVREILGAVAGRV
jgi:hydroxymethylpyrimidine kinase/phosphomethylpyrimidine kinase